MSENEDYNKKIEIIKTITDDRIKVPHHIPVGIYIQEAEKLYTWCQDDKEELKAKGLDWTVVEDLPIRCGALIESESQWQIEQKLRRKAEKIWVRESPKGYDLRNVLIHHFNYAFRDDSLLIGWIREIAGRLTHSGMIRGLKDLSALGKANQGLLTNIGFDLTLLDMASQTSDALNSKYAAGSWKSEDYREAKKIRNQAFTHLKEAVDLIREYGRYVFWRNAYRLKGYRSDYRRMLNKRSPRRNKVSELEPGYVPIIIDA
jgi:hypothetical protein